MTMKISILRHTLILPLLLAMACSDNADSPDPQEPASVGFKISTRAATDPGYPEDPADANEKINSYKIFLVDKQNKVRAVVEKNLGQAVEEDRFTANVPPGTYNFYAFANITDAQIANLEVPGDPETTNTIQSFFKLKQADITDNSIAPSFGTLKSVVWKNLENGFTGQIPMSGFRTGVTVTGKVEESFSIEVVRMLAKLQFEFSAPNAFVPVTIKEVTVHGLGPSKGNVPFMPDYDILGKSAPNLPKVKAEDFSFGDLNLTLTLNSEEIKSTGTKYLRESVASHPSGGYMISVRMNRSADGESAEDIRQYAIADELCYINRNDHIVIPIQITDWILNIEVHFYPPIGGYPAVITEQKNEEYHITFGTQGAFEITTSVRNAAPGSPILSKDSYNITVGTPSGDNIFTKVPDTDKKTGEILGEVSTAEGIAKVPLTIQIKKDGGSYEATSRNLYIIRKN